MIDPMVEAFESNEDEIFAVSSWISARIESGISPGDIAMFVRSEAEFDRAESAIERSGNQWATLTEVPIIDGDRVVIGTMHLAKGLEFRTVAVMACDEDILPDQERVESITDFDDLDEVIRTERRLFDVACTRASDFLWVSGVEPVSEFLDELENS